LLDLQQPHKFYFPDPGISGIWRSGAHQLSPFSAG
jgi:hypothetical protein